MSAPTQGTAGGDRGPADSLDPPPDPPLDPPRDRDEATPAPGPRGGPTRVWGRWVAIPLYWRILGAMLLGAAAGMLLKQHAGPLRIPADLIIRLLGALAPPLILLAVVQALMNTKVRGRTALRMAFLLALNTLVAIGIGLLVANTIRPGTRAPASARRLPEPRKEADERPDWERLLDQVPDSLLKPLVENNVIGVVFVAIAFGIALRSHRDRKVETVGQWVDLGFESIVTVLHWVIVLVPVAVFGMVAATVGTRGFAPFVTLAAFVGSVVAGLILQSAWYLSRVYFGSWVRPSHLLRGCRDALLMAFSTDSSTATMPVNYVCLRDKVGLREESARMGALVGTNFNNDGTALYEAMSALFIAQLVGRPLPLGQQVVVVLMSIVASVGAAGIPEAGTVTMLLVLRTVHLPVEYVSLLLTVDWFLDRCRTTVNIMGDMNVSCMLDGRRRERRPPGGPGLPRPAEPAERREP